MSMMPDTTGQTQSAPPAPAPARSRVEELLEAILAELKARPAANSPPAAGAQAPAARQGPAYPELSVEGLIISADQWANHWATFKRADDGLQVVAPVHAIASPLQWVDNEHGRWSIIPLRLASGKEQLVGVLPTDQGGDVGSPFEGQFGETEGVELAFVRSWCNVSGWEKSPAVRAREEQRKAQAAASAPAGTSQPAPSSAPPMEEPF